MDGTEVNKYLALVSGDMEYNAELDSTLVGLECLFGSLSGHLCTGKKAPKFVSIGLLMSVSGEKLLLLLNYLGGFPLGR